MSDTTRTHFQEELAGLERSALGGLDLVASGARPRARDRPATRTSSWRAWSSPTTTASTAATSRCTRGSCRCSRSRRRWPATCALVAALLHVIKHVERMGDQCVNMAKLVPLAGHEPPADAADARPHPADGRPGAPAGASSAARRSSAATWTWRRTSCARTTRSTGSTARSSTTALELGDDADQARVGDAHDARGPLHRAHRGQCSGHRRADRLRRHRACSGSSRTPRIPVAAPPTA